MKTTIRPALADDFSTIAALLKEESLPLAGVSEHLSSFLIAEEDRTAVGAIGLELYADTALLRSAVVLRSQRGK